VVPKALPDQVGTPVTEIVHIRVKISWNEPGGNGAEIIKYRVYLMKKSGEFVLETSHCSENDQEVFKNRYCFIPMAELTGDFYKFVKGDLIVAKV